MTDRLYRISSAIPEDRNDLLKLHKSARYETDYPLVPDYAQANLESGYYEKLWMNNFPDQSGEFYVITAKIGNQLIGFCRFGLLDAEEYSSEKLGQFENGLAELHQLYIDKDYRHDGIGIALYNAATETLVLGGYRHMLIAMIENNNTARAFYEKAGARHLYSYRDTIKRGDKVLHKMVAIYIHENIGPN